jgi:CRISPR-associated protein Cas1
MRRNPISVQQLTIAGRTHVQLIAEGYHPGIGVLHRCESGRGMYPSFALDRMEPMRPVVDRAIVKPLKATTLSDADFLIQPDGVCRLNPELARRVAK